MNKARVIQILAKYLRNLKLLDLVIDNEVIYDRIFEACLEIYEIGFYDGHAQSNKDAIDNWNIREIRH